MEQFFLEQLVEDKAYFEKIAQTEMVQVVLKEEAKRASAVARDQDKASGGFTAGSTSNAASGRQQRQKLTDFDTRLEGVCSRAETRGR
jgi:hypothetical protein